MDGSPDLASWSELTNFVSSGPSFQFTDTATNFLHRFYRARLIP
jgi:hypothetical protein